MKIINGITTPGYTIPFLNTEALTSRHQLRVKVTGYWSEPISIGLTRDFDPTNPGVPRWSFDISHSSGGRDCKAVLSDAEAARNLGYALIAAASHAEMLVSRADALESGFQSRCEEWRKAEQAAQAEREAQRAKLDAEDPPIGIALARQVVEHLRKLAVLPYTESRIVVVAQGTKAARTGMSVRVTGSGARKLSMCGTRYSVEEAIRTLATMSLRTLSLPCNKPELGPFYQGE